VPQKDIVAVLKLKDQLSANAKIMQKELRGISKAIEKNRRTLGDLKLQYIAIAAGLAVAARAFKGALDAQAKQEQSINSLNLALANQGNLLPGTSERLREYASELQKITTYGDEVIMENQALLASFGMNEEQLKTATVAALDFAAATGRDMKMAVNLVGKAFVGETGELSRYGIVIDKNIPKSEKFAEVMNQLTNRFGGAAAAQVQTFSGRLKQFQNALGDTQESLGFFIGQLFDFGSAGGVGIAVVERISKFFRQDLVIALGEARALFLEFMAVMLDVFAKLADGLAKIPIIGEQYKGIGDEMRAMAEGGRIAAEQFREESNAAALAGANTIDFKNKVGETATGLGQLTGALNDLNIVQFDTVENFEGLVSATEKVDEAFEAGNAIIANYLPRLSEIGHEYGVITIAARPYAEMLLEGKKATDEAASATDNFSEILAEAAHLTTVFGRTLGTVFGGAASAIGGFKSLFGKVEGGFSIGSFTDNFKKDGALSFGSFLSGISKTLPAIGALVGPAIAIFSKLFKPAWKKVAEESSKVFGKALSEGLSKELVKVANCRTYRRRDC
jgi:hypothetical protein